jgi:small subunit ribosomal protein S21
VKVSVKHNNIEGALRILKRKIKDSGLMVELRERQYYKKPSAIKSEKKKLGKVRNWIKQHQQNPDWCGNPPTAGLKEKIKKEQLESKK